VGKACGPAVDNCGTAVSCGTCATGLVCGSDNQCLTELGCGIGSDTATCLTAQGTDCLSCVQSNGCLDPAQLGGTCEDAPGTLAKFSGTLPDGQTCNQVLASPTETEAQVCLQTLSTIFTSQCAATLQETPCLCGASDNALCLAGSVTPTGAAYDLYACDFNTTSSTQIQSSAFTNQATGAGQANALVQCAGAFGCTSCFGQCTPLTPAQACGADTCGIAPDGCGATVTCGTCPAGTSCSGSPARCVSPCIPKTVAQACGTGTCGTAPDGCGGTVSCGTCPAGTSCSGSPAMCCTPQTPAQACGARICGSAPDGCGGAISCGVCSSGLVCGGDGQCHADPCTLGSNTTACLSAQGATCFQCAQSNGCLDPTQLGGSCEDTPGTSTKLAGALPDGTTCSQVLASSNETEAQVCLQTLGSIFTSKCVADLQETPCLCGATDPSACLSGSATPTGPLYDLYACDFDSASSTQIQASFTNQALGAGQANALIQCIAAFNCTSCFGQ
jgi:hypothetical protein